MPASRREDPADEHGEFAVRGGIVDIFPAGEAHPVRLEFIGDTIETLRTYDPSTQRSIAPIDQMAIVPLRDVLAATIARATLFDYLGARKRRRGSSSPSATRSRRTRRKLLEQLQQSYETIVAARPRRSVPLRRPPSCSRTGIVIDARLGQRDTSWRSSAWTTTRPRSAEPSTRGQPRRSGCQPAVELKGRVADWVAEIRRLRDEGETTLFVAATPGRAERTIELLKEYDVFADPGRARRGRALRRGAGRGRRLSRGFRLPDAGLQIYAEADVFEEERRAPERRRSATKAFLSDLRDLKVGDFVVHVDHGIGMFVGLKQIGVGDSMQEFLELRYAGEDKLFVPVERLDLVQKYTGATQAADRSARRHVVGARQDARSRRPCATWPRSCSSSTPRARRCRATPSAPIRTGSRSSRTRSSTS